MPVKKSKFTVFMSYLAWTHSEYSKNSKAVMYSLIKWIRIHFALFTFAFSDKYIVNEVVEVQEIGLENQFVPCCYSGTPKWAALCYLKALLYTQGIVTKTSGKHTQMAAVIWLCMYVCDGVRLWTVAVC